MIMKVNQNKFVESVVTIFTDGSCDNRIADFGAAAAIIEYRDICKEVVSGSWSSSTNNRMELLGIILGLESVKKGYKISLTTDSEVCLKWVDQLILENSSDNEISSRINGDLLMRLNKCLRKHKGNIQFKWTRGHIGVKNNERCDFLAGEAALRSNPTRDIGSGIGECPKMVWVLNEGISQVWLEHKSYLEKSEFHNNVNGNETIIGSARKMSNKEVTQLLKDKGWKPKDIKKLTIDKRNYQKPH